MRTSKRKSKPSQLRALIAVKQGHQHRPDGGLGTLFSNRGNPTKPLAKYIKCIESVWADSPGSRLDGTRGPETTTEWFTSLEEQLPSLVELRGKDFSNLADYLGDHTATFFNANWCSTRSLPRYDGNVNGVSTKESDTDLKFRRKLYAERILRWSVPITHLRLYYGDHTATFFNAN